MPFWQEGRGSERVHPAQPVVAILCFSKGIRESLLGVCLFPLSTEILQSDFLVPVIFRYKGFLVANQETFLFPNMDLSKNALLYLLVFHWRENRKCCTQNVLCDRNETADFDKKNSIFSTQAKYFYYDRITSIIYSTLIIRNNN